MKKNGIHWPPNLKEFAIIIIQKIMAGPFEGIFKWRNKIFKKQKNKQKQSKEREKSERKRDRPFQWLCKQFTTLLRHTSNIYFDWKVIQQQKIEEIHHDKLETQEVSRKHVCGFDLGYYLLSLLL